MTGSWRAVLVRDVGTTGLAGLGAAAVVLGSVQVAERTARSSFSGWTDPAAWAQIGAIVAEQLALGAPVIAVGVGLWIGARWRATGRLLALQAVGRAPGQGAIVVAAVVGALGLSVGLVRAAWPSASDAPAPRSMDGGVVLWRDTGPVLARIAERGLEVREIAEPALQEVSVAGMIQAIALATVMMAAGGSGWSAGARGRWRLGLGLGALYAFAGLWLLLGLRASATQGWSDLAALGLPAVLVLLALGLTART